jgi:hypothetical protein
MKSLPISRSAGCPARRSVLGLILPSHPGLGRTLFIERTEGLMAGMKGDVSCVVADRLLQPWLFPACRDRSGTFDGRSITVPPLQTIRKVTLALARRCRPIEGEGGVGFDRLRRLLPRVNGCKGVDATRDQSAPALPSAYPRGDQALMPGLGQSFHRASPMKKGPASPSLEIVQKCVVSRGNESLTRMKNGPSPNT